MTTNPRTLRLIVLSLAWTVLAIALFNAIVPLTPAMPSGGLDPSWQFAIGYAVAHHMQFGPQINFTYGPYAAIYTHIYVPGTRALTLVTSAYLATSYLFALACLYRSTKNRRSTWTLVAFSAIIILLPIYRESIFLLYPVICTIALICVLGEGAYNNHKLSGAYLTAVVVALCMPLSLLSLIKVSFAVPCAVVLGLISMLLVARRRYLGLVNLGITLMAFIVLLWILAHQRLASLPEFITRSLPLISGYTNAMSIPGKGVDFLALAISMGCAIYITLTLTINRLNMITACLIVALTLFILFKGGTVRHDGHVLVASYGILLVTLVVAIVSTRPRMAAVTVICASACTVFMDYNYSQLVDYSIAAKVRSTFLSSFEFAVHGFSSDGEHVHDYNSALSVIKKADPIPTLSGASDIYPVDISSLIASDNQWDPRPIFQSYSAYTPALATLNADHVRGANAPINIFFSIAPIDRRMPALEDGASWPALLTRYEPQEKGGRYIILKRLSAPAAARLTPIARGIGHLGIPVRVAVPRGPLVFATFDVKPSHFGRVLSLAFKPPALEVTLWLRGGAVRRYRLIASMAASPFLLSPEVSSTEQFLLLYGPPALSSERAVRAFRVDVVGNGPRSAWRGAYAFRLFSLNGAQLLTSGRIAALEGIETFRPFAWSSDREPTNSQCSLDVIDGHRVAGTASVAPGSTVTLGGWMGDGHGRAVTQGVFILKGRTQSYSVPFTTHIPRPDVAKALRSEYMATSGYGVRAALGGVTAGTYSLLVANSADTSGLCGLNTRLQVQ